MELRLELADLYHGEFLKGFDLSEWGMTVREFFEDRFMQHLTLAVKELLRRHDYGAVLELAPRGLEIDPFQDELQKAYIAAREKLGIKTGAYMEKVSTLFRVELGYEPSLTPGAAPEAFLELSPVQVEIAASRDR